jgi:hypothetical protein
MILREFSSNQPAVMISIPILIGAMTIALVAGGTLPVPVTTFGVDQYLVQSGTTWLPVAFAAVCLLLGSIMVNRLFNRHEFHDSPTYIPALIYSLCGMGTILLQFSPSVFLANLFLISGLDPLLSVYRQSKVISQYFKTGLGIGLAALIFPPYLGILPALWISVFYTRAFHWREHLLLLIGFGVPFLYWISFRYWNNELQGTILFHRIIGSDTAIQWLYSSWIPRIFSLSVIISFLFALPRYLFLSNRSSNKSKNVKSVFFIQSLGLIASLFLGFFLCGKWLIPGLVLPISVVAGYWYTNYRYSLVAPFAFYFLLVTSVMLCLGYLGIVRGF